MPKEAKKVIDFQTYQCSDVERESREGLKELFLVLNDMSRDVCIAIRPRGRFVTAIHYQESSATSSDARPRRDTMRHCSSKDDQ